MGKVIPIQDTVLMQQLAQGDRKAFEQVYRHYWQSLLDAAWKGLKDKQAAEDLVQGVFLSLWQKREQLHIHNIEAYLRTAKDKGTGKWNIQKEGGSKSSGSAKTQKEAEKIAKGYASNSGGGEVKIHGLDGKIRDSDTVAPGNDPSNIKDTKH